MVLCMGYLKPVGTEIQCQLNNGLKMGEILPVDGPH